MALESGSVSLRRFFPGKTLPKSQQDIWLEKLAEFRLKEPEQLEPDGENGGWAVLGNELSTEFTLQNVTVGPYVRFAYRRDTIKLPGGLVELHLKANLAVEEEFGEMVGRQKRQEMKEEVVQDLLASCHPHIESAGVLVDTSRQVIYFASTSERLTDEFLMLFYKAWGLQLVEADWENHAQRLLDDDDAYERVMARPGLHLVDNLEIHPEFEDLPTARLGASFLTWFYFFLQTGEGIWASEEIEEIAIEVDDALTLSGESFGSREIVLKKGPVAKCRELAAAFAAGKAVSKVRFSFWRGNEEDEGCTWSLGLDKKSLQLSGLKLPKSEEPDRYGQLMERFDALAEIFEILDDIVRDFLQMRISDEWPSILQDMRHWVMDMDGADGLWEFGSEAQGEQNQEPKPNPQEHKAESQQKASQSSEAPPGPEDQTAPTLRHEEQQELTTMKLADVNDVLKPVPTEQSA